MRRERQRPRSGNRKNLKRSETQNLMSSATFEIHWKPTRSQEWSSLKTLVQQKIWHQISNKLLHRRNLLWSEDWKNLAKTDWKLLARRWNNSTYAWLLSHWMAATSPETINKQSCATLCFSQRNDAEESRHEDVLMEENKVRQLASRRHQPPRLPLNQSC